jgi:hypothetical protein
LQSTVGLSHQYLNWLVCSVYKVEAGERGHTPSRGAPCQYLAGEGPVREAEMCPTELRAAAVRCGGVVEIFIAAGRGEEILPTRANRAPVGSRDSFRGSATCVFRWRSHPEVLERQRRALVKRCRYRLEITVGLPSQVRPLCDRSPLDTATTRRPARPRTSIYPRIDQLYGTTPAVPIVHEACQPDRRVNTDSATQPPFR